MPVSERIDTFQQMVDTLGAGSLSDASDDIVVKLKGMVADGIRDAEVGRFARSAVPEMRRIVMMLEQAGIGAEIKDTGRFALQLHVHLDGDLGTMDEGFDAGHTLLQKMDRVYTAFKAKYGSDEWTDDLPEKMCDAFEAVLKGKTYTLYKPTDIPYYINMTPEEKQDAMSRYKDAFADMLERISGLGLTVMNFDKRRYLIWWAGRV